MNGVLGSGYGNFHRPGTFSKNRGPQLLNIRVFPFRCKVSEYNYPYPRKILYSLLARGKKSARGAKITQNCISQVPLYRNGTTVGPQVYELARAEISPYAHYSTRPKVGRWRKELGDAAPPVYKNWNPAPGNLTSCDHNYSKIGIPPWNDP